MGDRTKSFGGVLRRVVLLTVIAIGALSLAGQAFAAGPTISSDKPDYAPGSVVTLTGAGWGMGESVHVVVNDDQGQTWSAAQDVVASLDGSFTTQVTLPNTFIATYAVTATGASGAVATSSFTDGNFQIQNGDGSTPPASTATAGTSKTYKVVVQGGGTGCDAPTWSATNATLSSTTGTTVTATFGLAGTATVSVSAPHTSGSGTCSDLVTVTVSAPPKQDQATLAVTGPSSATFGAADQAITTSGGSGTGALSFSAGSSTACSIVSGNLLHVTSGTGSCSITATKAGDSTYNSATSAPVTVTIAKANPDCSSVAGYSVAYDANAHTATGACKDLSGNALPGLDLTGTTHTGAGTYTDPWSFAGTTNYAAKSGTVSDTITRVQADCSSINGYAVTYDGNAHTATGACKDLSGNALPGLDLSQTTHTNAGTYNADAWSFAGTTNYAPTSGTIADSIGKAKASISVTPYDVTFDGDVHTASASATGVKGEALTGFDLSGTRHTDAGSYGADAWSFTNGNYQDASGTVSDHIAKADATIDVTPYDVTYDGDPHTATGSATGVGGVDLSGLLDLSASKHTDAGSYGDAWSFAGNGNYNSVGGSVTDKIAKAKATINVSGYDVAFDGGSHLASGSATGVKSEALSGLDLSHTAHTNAGSYTDSWSFANANYQDDAGSVADTIEKAKATIDVTPYDVTYDGDAHTAVGSATGVGGSDLSALLDLGGTKHTNAGSYSDSWSFAGNGNYEADGGSINDKIAKAKASVTVTPYDVVYDGDAHTASASATGVNGEALTGFDLSGTAHTNADTYSTDAWSFSNANYQNDSGKITDTIEKASASITVTPYDVTYDGDAHTADGSATGIGGVNLSTLLDLGGTKHTNAGSYGDSWSFAGNGNYKADGGTVTDKIGKAKATIGVSGYDVTFDGSSHLASGSATGVNGEALSGLDLSQTAHTNAGSYTDSWSFANANYQDDSGSVTDKIGKADATIKVTPYDVTYNGDSHTADGGATGVGGVDLSTLLDLGGTKHTNAGSYSDAWTFAGNDNYNGAEGSVTDKIGKASAVISLTPYDAVYDAEAHTASASATGVKGEALSGFELGGTTHTDAGTYSTDTWSFSNDNYQDDSGTITDTIEQASASIKVTPYSVTYDGDSHTADGSATGIGGVDLSGLLDLSGTKHTNAGSFTDPWTFAGNGNYTADSGTVADKIAKAKATINVKPYDVTYDGDSHTADGTAAGVGGVDLSGLLDLGGTVHTNAGSYGDAWSFAGNGNYEADGGSVTDKIAKAKASITVAAYDVTYDGDSHSATASATGVKGEALSGFDLSGTKHTDAGTYSTDAWSFANANYQDDGGTITDHIAKANAAINVTPYDVTYNGDPHTASGTATGVGDLDLSGLLDLTATQHTNAGSYSDTWSFAGNANYKADSGKVTDKIAKAKATITVSPYDVTYDAGTHAATAAATGVKGEALPGFDLSGTKHTDAGTYGTDAWSFSNDNYQNDSGTITDHIAKATATIKVSPYDVTYDGNAHLAAATATGVGGADLSDLLSLGGTSHTNAGSYTDAWSFAGNGNYNGDAGSVTDKINKANAVIKVTPYSLTYDGSSHSATATATGVKGDDLSALLDLSGTKHTDAGTYGSDNWSFTGNGNYNNDGGTVSDKIAQAGSVVTVTCPASVNYTAAAQTPCTAAVTGAGGLNQALQATYGSNTAVGTASASASYAGDANHTGNTDSKTFKIVYGYGEVQFLQPINGTAHNLSTNPDVSTFRAGSTVPVKVQVVLPNGTIVHPASAVWLTPQKGTATTQPVDESVYTDPASSGSNYTWDSSGQFSQYNWGTPKTGAGYFWLIGVKLDDGQTYTVYISLR